jgi:hypothetical protein
MWETWFTISLKQLTSEMSFGVPPPPAPYRDACITWVKSGEVERVNLKKLVLEMRKSFSTKTDFIKAGFIIKGCLVNGLTDEEIIIFHEHVPMKTRGMFDGLDDKRRKKNRVMTKIDLYFERLQEYSFPSESATDAQNRERIAYEYAAAVERVKSKADKKKKPKIIPEDGEDEKATGKRGAGDDEGHSKDVFLRSGKKSKSSNSSKVSPNDVLSHQMSNDELMFLEKTLQGRARYFHGKVFDMCGNIREKIGDPSITFNNDEDAVKTKVGFDEFMLRIKAVNVDAVEQMRGQSLPVGFDVDLQNQDPDIAEMSKLFMEMSTARQFIIPIECDTVVINPLLSLNAVLTTLQYLYLASLPFFILLPSHFLYIEEFAILFMGKGVVVHNMLPAGEQAMAWYFWDGSLKNSIKVRYVFNFASMEKMDYHSTELSEIERSCDVVGMRSDMLYRTDPRLIVKLGPVNAFDDADDDVSEMTDVNDLGESSRA